MRWTGPRTVDLHLDGVTLRGVVPPARWPYGPPAWHEDCCSLHGGGLFCDCKASDEGEDDWGAGA